MQFFRYIRDDVAPQHHSLVYTSADIDTTLGSSIGSSPLAHHHLLHFPELHRHHPSPST